MARKLSGTEIAAAKAVAAKAGLSPVTPQLLKLAKHTSVRLNPLPIVARLRSTTAFDDIDANLARELAIGRHLHSRGAPAVRPLSNGNAGPYCESGYTITLWEFVSGRKLRTKADGFAAARALKQVHRGLEDVNADLPSFTVAVDSCEPILSDRTQAVDLPANDRLFLERVYADLRNELAGRAMVRRPLHGDAHLDNVLITGSGAVWMDLEAVCIGPLEWDLVNLPRETWSEFEGIDPDLMRFVADLRGVCVAIWCWAEFGRSKEIKQAAVHHLGRLKRRFS